MDIERGEEHTPAMRSWRDWFRLLLPEARMRVATRRPPKDWFELLTRIPVIERIVIKRFVENLMCEHWLEEPHQALQGMSPTVAASDAAARPLLKTLLARMATNQEKTPRELRRIRKRLGLCRMLFLLAIWACATGLQLSAAAEEGVKRLGIVPFSLPPASAEREWLSDGFPRVLALRLKHLARLKVVVLPRPTTTGAGALRNPLDSGEATALMQQIRPQGYDALLFGSFHQIDATLRLEIHLWATRPERQIGKILEQAPERDPDGLAIRLATTVASALQLSPSEAERRRMEERLTTSAEAFERFASALTLGEASSGEEDVNRALQLLTEAVNLDGKFSAAQRQLADLYFRRGNYASAVEAYQSVLSTVKRDPQASHLLGTAYFAQGEANRAIAVFKHGVELDSHDPQLHLDLGLAYAAAKDYENATKALLRALEFKPDDALAFANLGVIYLLQGNFEAATSSLRRAQLSFPSDALIAYNVGLALMAVRLYDQARDQFERALQQRPDLTPAAYQLASVYERIDTRQAVARWKHYLELARGKPSEEAWMTHAQEHLKRLQEP